MVFALNLTGARKARSHLGGPAGEIAQPMIPASYLSDLAWRVMHAMGEMLALLWGLGALTAVGLFVAGIFS